LFRAGLGGKFGDGAQWQSWISIDDEVAAIAELLESEISGPVNLTAPNPVTQAQFVTALGDTLHRPTFMRVPRFAPKLVLGSELVENLLFSGQKVVPQVLLDHGYEFRHAELPAALSDLLGR
jgi:NAD dependent epimerase/dehydratase family enzyme